MSKRDFLLCSHYSIIKRDFCSFALDPDCPINTSARWKWALLFSNILITALFKDEIFNVQPGWALVRMLNLISATQNQDLTLVSWRFWFILWLVKLHHCWSTTFWLVTFECMFLLGIRTSYPPGVKIRPLRGWREKTLWDIWWITHSSLYY